MNINTRFNLGDQVTAMNGQIQGEVDGFYYGRSEQLHISIKWINEEGGLQDRYFSPNELKSA